MLFSINTEIPTRNSHNNDRCFSPSCTISTEASLCPFQLLNCMSRDDRRRSVFMHSRKTMRALAPRSATFRLQTLNPAGHRQVESKPRPSYCIISQPPMALSKFPIFSRQRFSLLRRLWGGSRRDGCFVLYAPREGFSPRLHYWRWYFWPKMRRYFASKRSSRHYFRGSRSNWRESTVYLFNPTSGPTYIFKQIHQSDQLGYVADM